MFQPRARGCSCYCTGNALRGNFFLWTAAIAVETSFYWKGITQMHKEEKNSRALHRNWKVWFAVALMLAAMLMYIVTLDDSVVPVLLK